MPAFSFEGRVFDFAVESVYDGDTCTLAFEHRDPADPVFVCGARTAWRCRLAGINAPELRPPLQTPGRAEVVRRAAAARNRLAELLGDGSAWRARCGEFEKYGRVLVALEPRGGGGATLNAVLVAEGFATPYME